MSDVKPVALDVARVHELISVYKEAYGPTNKQRARRDIVMYFIAHDAALQAEIEALRKDAVDAARWRALQKDRRTEIWTTGLHAYVDDAGLDEQADAAIAKEKQL